MSGGKNDKERLISPFTRLLSSNVASIIAVTGCFPLEVVKTRMQVQGNLTAKELINVKPFNLRSLLKIYTQEGVRGLYRGYSISIVCIPLFHTIYFPLYEHTKK